ncbi:MAG: hypothetical protein ACREC6_12310 [Hyphomicrobiaceae bacterium]
MQEQTLIEAIILTRTRIDFVWQSFVTVHLAVFALVLIYDDAVEGMNAVARTFTLVGIALFEWINGTALIDAYSLADALHHQFRADFGQPSKPYHPEFAKHFVGTQLGSQENLIMTTHGMAFAFVTMALLWRQFMQKRPDSTGGRSATDTD